MSYTELDAVNQILRPAGEASITDIDSTDEEVVQASAYLTSARKKALTKGWYFNRSVVEYTGGGISGKRIAVNTSTVLRLIPPSLPKTYNFIPRYDSVETATFLWDLDEESFELLTVSGDTLKIDTIKLLSWDDCPHAAQSYIAALAAFNYHNETVSDPAVSSSLQLALSMSWGDLRREQIQLSRSSMFSPRDQRLRASAHLWRF